VVAVTAAAVMQKTVVVAAASGYSDKAITVKVVNPHLVTVTAEAEKPAQNATAWILMRGVHSDSNTVVEEGVRARPVVFQVYRTDTEVMGLLE
jgi:hypothetical protein